jgi:vesicle-associated membrane protein 7
MNSKILWLRILVSTLVVLKPDNTFLSCLDNVAMRGERLELLVNKAESLNSGSVTFRKTSRNLARSMFWKNVKLYVIIGVIITVIVYFIVCMACGGLLWQGCLAKK